VRLYGSGRNVITGSADRSLKVWDVSQKTYRQTVTLRHGSSCNCVDVASDSVTAASGHLDGGTSRRWEIQPGIQLGVSSVMRWKCTFHLPFYQGFDSGTCEQENEQLISQVR
jgi:WD40 repeat protein